MMRKHMGEQVNLVMAAAIAAGVFIAATTARAQDQDQEKVHHLRRAGEAHEHGTQPNAGGISFSSGFDITNKYFFRGILQEDQGFIIEPWLDATVQLRDGVNLTFGIWNSFHNAQTGATSSDPTTGPDSWYEADLYIGVAWAVAERCQFGVTYTAYTSPNDAFSTIQEIALSSHYDDSTMWDGTMLEGSGLQPSITVAFETDGSALGPDEGVYLEIGIEPSVTLIESQDYPVKLSIPVTVGLSLSDYYEGPFSGNAANRSDPNFGYLDVGAVFSVPLSQIPADFGQWEMSLGLHWLYLNENTELANNGDDSEFLVTFGISMGY